MYLPSLALAALGCFPLLVSASPLQEITVTCSDDFPTTTETVTQTVYPSTVTVTQTVYDTWKSYGASMSTVTVSATSTGIGYAPAYATGPSGPAKTHSVVVGGLDSTGAPILRYNPESVSGAIGDVIEFKFLANNHTATQADFDSPCFPKPGGFDSGFMPNKANVLGQVTASFKITTDAPEWFYCSQKAGAEPHCQAGMVFAVNAAQYGEKTLENFRNKAAVAPLVMPTNNYSAIYTTTPVYTATTTPMYTATAAAASVTYYVNVGGLVSGSPNPVLRYDPEYVIAQVGDVIKFNFLAANHTVTQSSFDSPCVGIPDGFKTGVQMNPNNTDRLIAKEFVVNDSEPLWFYCGVPTHCQQGMVFSVNPLDKFPAFQAKAMMSV